MNFKGNREQGTGNSVGFGRGFDPVQNKAAYRGGGLQLPRIIEKSKPANGKQFVPHCSPFPVPCSLFPFL